MVGITGYAGEKLARLLLQGIRRLKAICPSNAGSALCGGMFGFVFLRLYSIGRSFCTTFPYLLRCLQHGS